MKLVIVESKNDVFCVKKKYPHPLELIEDNDKFLRVKEHDNPEFNIYKNKISKYDVISIKEKLFNKIK